MDFPFNHHQFLNNYTKGEITLKNKLAKTTVIIGLALGSGVIGYAASNAFQDLDTIKANFNTVLQYGQTKSQRVSELESQLSNNTRTQEEIVDRQCSIPTIEKLF